MWCERVNVVNIITDILHKTTFDISIIRTTKYIKVA